MIDIALNLSTIKINIRVITILHYIKYLAQGIK